MGRNTVSIWTRALQQYLLITVKVIALEIVAFSDKENPKTVCKHIHCRRQALFAESTQFNATNSDASISKTKNFPQFFVAFAKSILNFKHFPRKYDPHSWSISGITGSEKHGQINV